ncbi:unnamed protein product, partial [Ascophyllum nodosum]
PPPASPRLPPPPPVLTLKEDQGVNKIIKNIADKGPPWLAKFFRGFAPSVTVTLTILDLVGPVLLQVYGRLYQLYKILPVHVIGMVYGLTICFFGGFFHLTIAAVETFSTTGGEKVWAYVNDLMEDLKMLHMANKEDDKRDDDDDGIPDVQQISADKLVSRKASLALRVINPERAINAITGIWQGYLGVLVILKFRFAKTISLAVSIGNYMKPTAAKIFGPSLAYAIPKEYHEWIAPMINVFCKFVAMTIAWWIQRFISTVQSAVKGGLLFSRSLMRFISDTTSFKLDPDDSFMDEILGWTLAACGAYFQIGDNWNLPVLVRLLLWPAYFTEIFLQWSVTWMDAPPAVP